MPTYCRCAGDFDLTFPAKVSTLKYIKSLQSICLFPFDIVLTAVSLFSFFHYKELLGADRSVSEHSVPLQHELPGGDH